MPITDKSKLDELIAKLPAAFQPIAKEYADIFLNAGIDEITNWIALASAGDYTTSYLSMLHQLPYEALMAEWQRANVAFAAANDKAKALQAYSQNFVMQIAMIALAMVRVAIGITAAVTP